MADITTIWGKATVVDEVRLQQRAGDKRFASLIQLLEDPKGERLVRFAYTTDGATRRGPVTLRAADRERLPQGTGGARRARSGPSVRRWLGDRRRGAPVGARAGRLDERPEDECAVGRADERVDRVLGVGHQPHDVAALVADGSDVRDRTVRVVLVAKDDLAARLELREEVGVGEPTALPVLDRDRQALPRRAAGGEGRVGALDSQNDITTDERERRVRPQRAGQQPRLAEDLEAVADPEHEAALGGEGRDRSQRRREAGDRAAPEVVAVREPAGQDDGGDIRETIVTVPDRYPDRAERLER